MKLSKKSRKPPAKAAQLYAAAMAKLKCNADRKNVKTKDSKADTDSAADSVKPSGATPTQTERSLGKAVDEVKEESEPSQTQSPTPPSPTNTRKTRSRTESRGRRQLICKICRFTCSDSQEFTQHRNTAHTERAGAEDSAQLHPARRHSARHRRTSSTGDVEPGRKSKKAEFVRQRLHSKTDTSSGKPTEAEATAVESEVTTPIPAKPSTPSTNPKPAVRRLILKLQEQKFIATLPKISQAVAQEEPQDTQTTAAQVSAAEYKEPEEKEEESREGCADHPHSIPEADSTIAPMMISTTSPTPAVQSELNMSGASEDDEHDLSEEGDRLVIDDSMSGGSSNNGTVVTPTRCGNIQNRTYMCEDCDFSTTSAQQSLRHQKDVHGYDFTIYMCDLCDYATKYKQKLPRHRNLHFSGTDLAVNAQGLGGSLSFSASTPSTTPSSTPGTPALASLSSPLPNTPNSSVSLAGTKRTAAEAGLSTPAVLPTEVILEEGEDDDGDEDDLVESDNPTPPPVEGDGPAAAAAVVLPVKKKRKDVSPDKYFEVSEEVSSTKYGCAKCGNVYKWKKSLNKHWKEKHGNNPGDNHDTPPGMTILLQQNNHVQTEKRKCCHKTLLARITVKNATSNSRSHTPQNFLNGHYNAGSSSHLHLLSNQQDDVDGEEPMAYLPSNIPAGPFVLGTNSQPVFPASGQRQSLINSLNAPIPSASVLDLTNHGMDETDSVETSSTPLDFSVQKTNHAQSSSPKPRPPSSSLHPTFTSQGVTTEEDDEVSALDQLVASSSEALEGKEILKCPKCGEVLKTQTAYSNHVAMHLQSANKKVTKCGVCKSHFHNMDALNVHFNENHMDLIASHKEAIQKIPHGLQQTYHLLKTEVYNIPKLSTQELDDPLKCNMCDFTAKWPAELQKHAVSHSDERPFVCMVCGSTYKWKWDLVKHFEKAHSGLPNPYKRRDPNAPSTSGGPEPQPGTSASGSHDSYDIDEGDMSAARAKDAAASDATEASNSFLFDQTSGQDEISVENILRTSREVSFMVSRQPNFLDSPENTQASTSASPHPENMPAFDMSTMQNISLPTSNRLDFAGGEYQADDSGNGSRPARQAPAKTVRGRQREGEPSCSSSPGARCNRNGSRGRSPYRSYRTVENSESSELRYQCVLCEYKARWPSEIMQHMKNHSSEKPYGCPYCSYRSKWKWDVVKHLKRCGSGGTIKDVVDLSQKSTMRDAPPNVMVTPEGSVVQAQPSISPTSGTTSNDESSTSGQQVTSMASEGQSSTVPTPAFLSSLPTAVSATSPAFNALRSQQAYVSLIYQQMKAGNEAAGSQSAVPSAAPTPSLSPSQPEQQGSQGAVTYNSIISDGQHHCLSCSFVATSLAELRRHQVVHSDEKPYSCDECSYSTKWKCDMKKHKEKYNHNKPYRYTRPGGDVSKDGDKTDRYKCPHCTFEAPSTEALQSHIHTEHASRATSGNQTPSGPAKFRCKKCPFTTNELGDWISHRHTHQTQKDQEDSRQSPSTNGAREHDEARLRHPRKAVKQYVCTKCEFVCVKSIEFLNHMNQAHGPHNCPFCSQRFDIKETFLDHIITHPEFKMNEWEFFFRADDENEEDFNNNTDNAPAVGTVKKANYSVSVVDTGSTANTIDLTTTTTTTSPPLLIAANGPQTSVTRLPCQWCPARFANIVRLYHHVSQVHPDQKREQEIAEGLAPSSSEVIRPIPRHKKQQSPALGSSRGEKRVSSQHGSAGKRTPSPPRINGKLSSLTSSLATSMGHSLLTAPTLVAQLGQTHSSPSLSQSLLVPASDTIGLNLSTKKPHKEPAPVFQCTKCSFKTGQLDEYQHHIFNHIAPKNTTQSRGAALNALVNRALDPKTADLRCWFCGLLQKSYLLVYQHMQEQHPRELERSEQRDELIQKIVKEMQGSKVTQRSEADKVFAAVTSTMPSPMGSGPEQIAQSLSGVENWLHTKVVMTYEQIPLQAMGDSLKGEMWYKCIFCNDMDRNPANIAKHTRQVHHHSLPQKYQCGYCSHSSEKVQAMLQHQGTAHTFTAPCVHVLQFKEISLPGQLPAADNANRTSADCPSTSARSDPASTQKVGVSLLPLIKQEPLCLSPPQATSSPLPNAVDCRPLDLSKEVVGDSHSASNNATETKVTEEKMDTDEDSLLQQKSSSRTPQCHQDDREAQEIMEAEAANDYNKVVAADSGSVEDRELPEFKCKHCPYSTHSSFEFRTHFSCHGLKGLYQCHFCSFSHSRLDTICQHHAVHSHQPGYTPKYIPQLNQALSAKNEGSVTPRPASLPPAPETQRCPDCPYRTTDPKNFKVHLSMHGQMLQYICDFCDWSADRLVMVLQHRNIHKEDPDFNTSPEDHVFANAEYPKVAPGEFEAKRIPSEEGEYPPFKMAIMKKSYNCPQCPYVSRNGKAYDVHMKLHGGDGCFPCEQCSYSTQNWSHLCQHTRLHEQQQQHQKSTEQRCASASSVAPQPPKSSTLTTLSDQVMTSQSKTEPARERSQEEPTKDVIVAQRDCPDGDVVEDDESVEIAEFPDREADDSSSPASDYGSLKNEEGGAQTKEVRSGGELQCQRCPFSTSSKLLLNQHYRHHSGRGEVVCPCCDYACPSKENLLVHTQLHFPATLMDMDTLQQMLDSQHKDAKTDPKEASKPVTSSGQGELSLELSGEKKKEGVKGSRQLAATTTRVYACRFCDREFEDKDVMIQHERQHKG